MVTIIMLIDLLHSCLIFSLSIVSCCLFSRPLSVQQKCCMSGLVCILPVSVIIVTQVMYNYVRLIQYGCCVTKPGTSWVNMNKQWLSSVYWLSLSVRHLHRFWVSLSLVIAIHLCSCDVELCAHDIIYYNHAFSWKCSPLVLVLV